MIQSFLILKLDTSEERVYPLESRLTLGRKSSNAICLSGLSVSRQHAVVHLMEDQAIIKDMDSRNGTFVNGKPIKSRALSNGDIIRIGKTTLSFVQKESDQEEQPHSEIAEVSVPDELERPSDQSSLQEAATSTPTDSASLIHSSQVNQYQIQEIAHRQDLEKKPDRTQCYLSVHLDLKDKLNSLLKAAESSVYFLMHMLDDRDTVRTLSRIKNEGIAVKGVLSFEQLDQLPQVLVDLIDDQLDVKVTAPTDPILFHNTIIIDQQIVVSCPMYQSRRTDARLDANLLVVEDKSFAQAFLSEFNRLRYNISKRYERTPYVRSVCPDEKSPLVASPETEAEHFVEELTQTPENFKRLLSGLLRQDRKDKAVELINARVVWEPDAAPRDGISNYGPSEESAEKMRVWTVASPTANLSDQDSMAQRPRAAERGVMQMNDSAETVSETSASDYWHEQVGEGLTRRKIFMMKQKFRNFVKRSSLLCAVSLSLSLAIILALPQMVFISYIAFFCFAVSFVILYVSLIVFNYRLAKAFQRRAALWAFLSLFFVPALFLYSWLMKKS